jgi:hypothetical protein
MLLGLGAFAEFSFSQGGPPVTYVSVTGNALALSTGSVTTLQAITWSEIDPGVTMTWTEIDPS